MPASYGPEDAIDDARFALTGIVPESVIGEDVFLRLVAAVAKALLEARRAQAQADGNVEAAQYFKSKWTQILG